VVVGVWLDKRLKLTAGANVSGSSDGRQQTILEIGNILREHDVSVNFGIADSFKKEAQKEKKFNANPLLFQIQVDFTKEDGSRYKRFVSV